MVGNGESILVVGLWVRFSRATKWRSAKSGDSARTQGRDGAAGAGTRPVSAGRVV